MVLTEIRPMLRTPDVDGTLAFYTRKLGFKCSHQMPQWEWAQLVRDNIRIMISGLNEHAGDIEPRFTGSLYITCDNVDQLWTEFSEQVEISYKREEFEYGMREFGIYDNNGYLIQFGQPLD